MTTLRWTNGKPRRPPAGRGSDRQMRIEPVGYAGCRDCRPSAGMRHHGFRMILWPDWCWRRCWSRSELPMRWRPACRGYTASTQRSFRCWSMRCSGPAASWSWGRTVAGGFILSVVLPLSGGDPLRAVTLAGMLAIVSGTVCILTGVARLGFVTELISKPIRYGYMNGIALTVLISQLPALFGFSIESEGPLRDFGRSPPRYWRDERTGRLLCSGQARWQ